jgi:diphthine-ammonia ligase
MHLVALISGGKDSLFAMHQCITVGGHDFIAVANLTSATTKLSSSIIDNGESFMYQLQGSEFIQAIATCLNLPLIQRTITGKPIDQSLKFTANNNNDEVNDLYELLFQVKQQFPTVQGVCCGAVLSTYQRIRVEHVCEQLGLSSIAMLWQRPQLDLVQDMISNGFEAILVKIASMGLTQQHLGKTIRDLLPTFIKLEEKFGFHVCGEGGEYESIVLDCPLFQHQKIVLDKFSTMKLSENCAVLIDPIFHIVDKTITSSASTPSTLEKIHVQIIEPRQIIPRPNSIQHREKYVHLSKRNIITATTTAAAAATATAQSNTTTIIGPIIGDDLQSIFTEFFVHFNDNKTMIQNRLVFVHMFVRDLNDFNMINIEYEKHFKKWFIRDFPSRATVELAGLTQRVAIIGWLTTQSNRRVDTLHVKSISCWAPVCIGPYSQCNLTSDGYIFVAGQIALDPVSMKLANPNHNNWLEGEVRRSLLNAMNVMECMVKTNTAAHHSMDLLTLYKHEIWTVYVSSYECHHEHDLWNKCVTIYDIVQKISNILCDQIVFVGVARLPRDASVEFECVGKLLVSSAKQEEEEEDDKVVKMTTGSTDNTHNNTRTIEYFVPGNTLLVGQDVSSPSSVVIISNNPSNNTTIPTSMVQIGVECIGIYTKTNSKLFQCNRCIVNLM